MTSRNLFVCDLFVCNGSLTPSAAFSSPSAGCCARCIWFLKDYAAVRSVCEEKPWRVAWAASQNADPLVLGVVYVCTLI